MVFLFNNLEFKKLIIDLNTKSQLYQQGIDETSISTDFIPKTDN